MTTHAPGDAAPATRQPLTIDDLARRPRDEYRHELLDGTLMTSPPPSPLHQITAARLAGMLLSACPDTMSVLPAPALRLSRSTQLTPDLAITRHAPAGSGPRTGPPSDTPLTQPPLLAVEVCSPLQAPAAFDRRMAAYAAFGVWSHWILTLGVRRPELTVFELGSGRYQQTARATGGDVLRTRHPFCTEITPAQLTAGLYPAGRG
ncbi:MAG TPA: Uma2 family endonuclease [Streptosporangiaceae bacterium]|jgi:Uma2 family endonuclease